MKSIKLVSLLIVLLNLVCLPAYSQQLENEKRIERFEKNLILEQQEEGISNLAESPESKQLYSKDSVEVGALTVSTACISSPLPTSPVPPSYKLDAIWSDRSNERAVATIWRQPCKNDPNKAAVLLRFEPSNNPFICSGNFIVVQSGVQYDSVKLVNSVGGNSFCDDMFIAQTLLMDQWSIKTNFNEDGAFELIHDGFDATTSTNISAYTPPTQPPTEDIIMKLEEPNAASNYSGVSNIRGYALSPNGISKIELYVNGQYKSIIPYGGSRGDVGNAYPEIPGSRNSGFGMTYNYNNLASGQNTITIRATSNDGTFKEVTNKFTEWRFQKPFFPDDSSIDIRNSTVGKDGSRILIKNLSVDGQLYDVWLKWKKQTQGFEIDKIE